MDYKILTPGQAIAKIYLKERIEVNLLNQFRESMRELFQRINPSESEEFNKNLVVEFFNKSLYNDRRYMVNTYQRTDLAIYSEMGTHNEHPVVLFEFKGPNRPDMVTTADLKKKSLYELILYYIREEVRNHNSDIKHLIITNCREYFVFEKKLFYQLFVKNRRFAQRVLDADTGNDNTDYIYNEIIKPKVELIEHRLQFVHIDLTLFERKIHSDTIMKNRSFLTTYKFFSPVHLLKLPFTSDHNTLNKNFYRELLYIIGVEEVTDNGVHKIKRLKNNRQTFSLLEQAYNRLEDYSNISTEEQRFDIALGLVLIWTNRILFLKLLESQLKNFNRNSNVSFLDIQHISNYNILHDLFFKALAKPLEERNDEIRTLFANVPYLNSSLFELSKLEQDFFSIGSIRLGNMEVYRRTVLKDGNGRRLSGEKSTLDYLFAFLNAYDFGSDLSNEKEITRGESKTLINASVLGLIFEKINGYKDGSFFTPGYITEYICHETLRRAVVDKFNIVKSWHCEDFEELKEHIEYGQREVRIEANKIINSLKICDPAVGSGHFLVSALNEIIAIKSELGVLQDCEEQPKRINEYDIKVEYDELVIADEDGEIFKYDPANISSQRIQEALFEEKRTIIENCLFGVDLNPKSVEICRLRLWIELLKSAYYYRTATGERMLQTLPNIDINIKCGNSLASVHPVCIERKIVEKAGMQNIVRIYKQNVKEYKSCKSKALKNQLNQDIQKIKRRLCPEVQFNLFNTRNNKALEAQKMVFSHSMEWMIEFPELLSEDGKFKGFDVIIGNPPYISLEKLRTDASVYARMKQLDENNCEVKTYGTLVSRGDIYTLFVERGLQLLRRGGLLSYIIPNKWEKVMYGKPLRELFLNFDLSYLVDFGDNQIFEDATTYTCIIRMSKAPSSGQLQVSNIKNISPETIHEDAEEQKELFDKRRMNDGVWVTSSYANFEQIERYKTELTTLGEFIGGEAYRGILTGLSEAFNISVEKANELCNIDACSQNILRPFLQGRDLVAYDETRADSYLIFIPKGFTAKGMGVNREKQPLPTENDAWHWFRDNYPAVASWLLQFADKARRRSDKGDYWWELRACAYYDKFAELKIFYQAFQTKPCFVFDESSTFCNNSMFFMTVADKSLLALLCSKVGWWLTTEFCPRIQNGAQLIWDNFKQIPIPHTLPEILGEYADKLMASRNDEDTFNQLSSEVDAIIEEYYQQVIS